MIEELAHLVDDFPGPANQTRCFLHILNLVVKSIIRQFDVPASKKRLVGEEDDENMDKATKELLKLAGEIDVEEEITVSAGDEGDATEEDDAEGWVDEHEEMTEDELLDLAASVRPVRLLLTKVC
jgi:nucleoside-diphosphate-sugar epimerase